MPARSQIDDRKPAMAESYSLIGPDPCIVRSPLPQPLHTIAEKLLRRQSALAVKNADNSAHAHPNPRPLLSDSAAATTQACTAPITPVAGRLEALS